jgi:hypothetical protein
MTSLWEDPEIKKTIDLMDPKTRYEYSKIGENLFRIGGAMDIVQSIEKENTTLRHDPDSCLFDVAVQLKLMLRDGLNSNDLTENEKHILISIYGAEEMEREYGIVYKHQDDDKSLPNAINISYPSL